MGLNRDTRLTWLGHATWLIESPAGLRIVVDPFIEPNPMCPDEFKGDGIGHVDVILVTHGHFDHVSDLLPLAQRTGAVVVGIFDLVQWVEAKGHANVSGMNKGGTQTVKGLHITLTDAVHSSSFLDGDVLHDLGDPAGFVVKFENDFTLYLAGDTAVFGDMALIGELYRPDAAVLPIGDHFTMGPREAAKAVELLGVSQVIPNHYGTFPVLSGTPEAFAALLPDDVELITPQPGSPLE